MKFSQIGFVLLCALLRIVPLFAQDSLAVKGKLNDTLMLSNATVTARSQEQQLREGAYAVGAVTPCAISSTGCRSTPRAPASRFRTCPST